MSFALPVNLVVVSLCHVFESCFYELLILFDVVCDSDRVFIVSKINKLCVDERVVDVLVTQDFS
jgi:hypothetical protein